MTEEQKENVARVREDLRRIKKLNACIDTALRVEEKYLARLKCLEGDTTPEGDALREKINEAIRRLNVPSMTGELAALEAVYLPLIESADALDRAIMLGHLIEGMTIAEIARKNRYSEDAIKKRVARVVSRIAENR